MIAEGSGVPESYNARLVTPAAMLHNVNITNASEKAEAVKSERKISPAEERNSEWLTVSMNMMTPGLRSVRSREYRRFTLTTGRSGCVQ